MANNNSNSQIYSNQLPADLGNSELECLRRFNQTFEHYNGTRYMSVSDSASFGYTQGGMLLITVFYPLILAIGMLGNGAFIYVAVKVKHMRTITNRYLVNLAIADIIFLTSAIGPKLWRYGRSPLDGDDTPLGLPGCISVIFLSDMSYFASLFFVTLVSLDRYVAVCRPQDRNSGIKGISKELISGAWIISCLLAAFLTPANAKFVFYCYKWAPVYPYNKWPASLRVCLPIRPWMAQVSLAIQTLPFFITFVLNSVLYVSIIHGLSKSMGRLNQQGLQRIKDSHMRSQIAKMLVVNGLVFFVCLSPFEFASLFYLIATSRGHQFIISNYTVRSYISQCARILSYVNASVNPIIYTVMCDRYILAFKQAFIPIQCRCNKQKDNGNYDCMRSRTLQTEMTSRL